MKTYHRLQATFSCLLVVVLLAACAGSAAEPTATALPPMTTTLPATAVPPAGSQPAASQSVPHQARPDAPPYAVRGPFAVGVRDVVIEASGRQMTVSVWYPALNPDKQPEAITYDLDFPTNDFPEFTIAGRALRDASPDLSAGPYPLMIYSHSGWGYRQEAAYLMEHLASRGFVVMAAGHEDNWGMLAENFYRSEISRPQDVSREIDLAEKLTAAGGALAGLIDTARVAVAGASLGGQVALEKAGARLNLVEQQKTYCADWPGDLRCEFYATPMQEMAGLAGLDALPDGVWPDWSDPRVDVIVLIEPAEGSLGALPVTVQVPVLLIEGTVDVPGYGMAGISSPHKTAVTLANASHPIYINACAAQPGMAESDFYWVCADPVWDMNRAHDLFNHFTTAFLLAELKGDTEAAKALAPDNVSFTGVTYETTAYGTAAAAGPPDPGVSQGVVGRD